MVIIIMMIIIVAAVYSTELRKIRISKIVSKAERGEGGRRDDEEKRN